MSLSVVLKCFSAINTSAPLSMVLKHCGHGCLIAGIRYVVFILDMLMFINTFLLRVVAHMCFPSLDAGTSLAESALSFQELSELMETLPGFLMLLTGEGRLLYLSDSVSEHLGHSMVSPHGIDSLVV